MRGVRIVLRSGTQFVLFLTPEQLNLIQANVVAQNPSFISDDSSGVTFAIDEVALIQRLGVFPTRTIAATPQATEVDAGQAGKEPKDPEIEQLTHPGPAEQEGSIANGDHTQ